MVVASLLRPLCGLIGRCHATRRHASVPRRAVRLAIEALEDRVTPSTLFVPAQYSTIQSAINAASAGDHVRIAQGTYQEQVTINKSISIDGSGPSTIILAPTNLGSPTTGNPDAIVHVTGTGTFAEIDHLTIAGSAAGTPNLLYGVRVDGNAFAEIEHDAITNIIDAADSSFGTPSQLGVAIDVGNTGAADGTSDQVGYAEIANDNIANYQRAGVVIDHAGSLASVRDNTIAGGPASTASSVTGVEVSNGAVADIEHNSISGNTNSNAGTGVLLFKPGVLQLPNSNFEWEDSYSAYFVTAVANNNISGDDYGVFGSDVTTSVNGQTISAVVADNHISGNTFVGIEFDNSSNVVINDNHISDNGSQNTADGGIYLFQTTNSLVSNNQCNDNNGSGIYLDAGSTGNFVLFNRCTGNSTQNGNADGVDLSTGSGTAGTANFWINNQGQTFSTISGQTLFQGLGHKHWWDS
jgi:parallel beta-helix repeat protein